MQESFSPELYPLALFTIVALFAFTVLVISAAIESISIVSKELTFKILFNAKMFLQLIKERMVYVALISAGYVIMYLFMVNYQCTAPMAPY